MCSIILRVTDTGILIGANRDENLDRAWLPPARHWPDLPSVIAGKDLSGGGTWMGLNDSGVMAAVLNREGTLGPAPGKRSRGELPLIALQEPTAATATTKFTTLDAALYRSFNLVIADAAGAFFMRGLEHGQPEVSPLTQGTWMITSGEPNDLRLPRIARHLPKFRTAGAENWPALLADNAPPAASALNIPPDAKNFGTVCSAVLNLPKTGAPSWLFSPGPAQRASYQIISLA
jgi:uncharacterized protein with NRDE domain